MIFSNKKEEREEREWRKSRRKRKRRKKIFAILYLLSALSLTLAVFLFLWQKPGLGLVFLLLGFFLVAPTVK